MREVDRDRDLGRDQTTVKKNKVGRCSTSLYNFVQSDIYGYMAAQLELTFHDW